MTERSQAKQEHMPSDSTQLQFWETPTTVAKCRGAAAGPWREVAGRDPIGRRAWATAGWGGEGDAQVDHAACGRCTRGRLLFHWDSTWGQPLRGLIWQHLVKSKLCTCSGTAILSVDTDSKAGSQTPAPGWVLLL